MLLLMPYYSSGPIGDKAAADAAAALRQAEQDLQQVMSQLASAGQNPEDLRKLLEEARRRLEEAQQRIAELKRDNDALNAQAQRLDAENQDLRKKNTELAVEQRKVRVTGQMLNWDCPDVRLEFGLLQKDAFITLKDGRRQTFVLNHQPSLGSLNTFTDDDMVARGNRGGELGRGMRFNQSAFFYAAEPGTYYLVLASRSKATKQIDGLESRVLKQPRTSCRALMAVYFYAPAKDAYYTFFERELTVSNNDYALLPAQLVVDGDDVSWLDPAPEARAWLQDQIAHAEKDETRGVDGLTSDERRQRALEQIERLRRDGERGQAAPKQ
jgi:exonuclease VII large subunit